MRPFKTKAFLLITPLFLSVAFSSSVEASFGQWLKEAAERKGPTGNAEAFQPREQEFEREREQYRRQIATLEKTNRTHINTLQQTQQREEQQQRELQERQNRESAIRQLLHLEPNGDIADSLRVLISRANEVEQQRNAAQEQLEEKNQQLNTLGEQFDLLRQQKERVEREHDQHQQREQRLCNACGIDDPAKLLETVTRLQEDRRKYEQDAEKIEFLLSKLFWYSKAIIVAAAFSYSLPYFFSQG